jgi:hypothetical protein
MTLFYTFVHNCKEYEFNFEVDYFEVLDIIKPYIIEDGYDWDDEDENEGKVSSEKTRKNFFENFFQLQGFLPDDDDEIYLE